MVKGCTPDNAVGAFLARLTHGGFDASDDVLEGLEQSGRETFNIDTGKLERATITLTNPSEEARIEKFLQSSTVPVTEDSTTQAIGNIFQNAIPPTSALPEDVTSPLLQAVDEFGLRHGSSLSGKQKLYKGMIAKALNKVDVEQLNAGQKAYLKTWTKDLQDGYPFYNPTGNRVSEMLGNVAGQQISLSGNVLAGNPFEIMIKAPSLYGFGPTLQGIGRALELTNGNLWGKIPELEARGIYGFNPVHENAGLLRKGLGAWQQFSDSYLALTNNPLVNIAYGIDGTRGVEKIAFVNRLGNGSQLQRHAGSAGMLRFLNYTIGSYHLLGSMLGGLTNPATAANSARGLATYFGILGALGGATSALEGKDAIEGAKASMIPEPLSWLLSSVDPSYKEWESENLSGIGRLVRPGGISGIGIIASTTNRNLSNITKQLELGAYSALEDGDIGQAAIHFSNAGLYLAPFLTLGKGFGGKGVDEALDFIAKGPLGNPRIRSTIQTAQEIFTGELDQDEGYEKLKEKWLPFLKEPQ